MSDERRAQFIYDSWALCPASGSVEAEMRAGRTYGPAHGGRDPWPSSSLAWQIKRLNNCIWGSLLWKVDHCDKIWDTVENRYSSCGILDFRTEDFLFLRTQSGNNCFCGVPCLIWRGSICSAAVQQFLHAKLCHIIEQLSYEQCHLG